MRIPVKADPALYDLLDAEAARLGVGPGDLMAAVLEDAKELLADQIRATARRLRGEKGPQMEIVP